MPAPLIPLTRRLQSHAKNLRLDLRIVELDYLLSWILRGLAEDPVFGHMFVFKGGTALKKCYFTNYRFSEDLDFTALPGAPSGDQLSSRFAKIVAKTQQAMEEYAPIILQWNRYTEKDPHPENQEAFKIRAQLPNQREPLISAMVEISYSEEIIFKPSRRTIFHDYGEPFQQDVLVYSLEEVVLEKLRGILQHTKKLHEKGWTRSRTRDYYDLYRLMLYEPALFENEKLAICLKKKCEAKKVSFHSVEDFFDHRFLQEVRKDWEHHLGYLMKELPPLQEVLTTLRKGIQKILPTEKTA